jgi:hypothetical protein
MKQKGREDHGREIVHQNQACIANSQEQDVDRLLASNQPMAGPKHEGKENKGQGLSQRAPAIDICQVIRRIEVSQGGQKGSRLA